MRGSLINAAARAARRSALWLGLVALSSTAGAAQSPSVVVESGGARMALQGSGAQCVYDDAGLHCAPPTIGGGGPAAAAAASPRLVGVVTFTNNFATTVQAAFTLLAVVGPHPASPIAGSVGGGVTDGNLDGVGGMATQTGLPLYRARIDGTVVASLLPDPTAAPGPMFPGTFSAPGASVNVPSASFGLTPPGQTGPAVVNTIEMVLAFQVAAGDTVSLTALFAIADGAPAATAPAAQPLVAGAPGTTPGAPIEVRVPGVAAAAGDVCPQRIAAGVAIVNLSTSPVPVVVMGSTPAMPLAATVIGGSLAGAATDGDLSGSGGFAASGTAPLYEGLVDAMPLAAAQLYPAPFSVPASGTFPAPGDTALLSPASFGLTGPAISGPSVASTIGVMFSFTLGGGDVVAMSSVFFVDCPPTPTPTPSATPTQTPAPQGGSCSDTSQCVAGLSCADGVCCDTPCDGPLQQCNVPSSVGTCTSVAAPSPAASPLTLLVALGALAGIAAWALRRLRPGG